MLTRRQLLAMTSGSTIGLVLAGCAADESDPDQPAPTTARSSVGQSSSTAAPGGTAQASSALEVRARRLRRRLLSLDLPTPVVFGVFAYNKSAGETYGFRSARSFETASVVKVDILAAALLQAQDEDRWLTRNQRALARQMITASSNDAATALFRQVGRARGLQRANDRFGLTRTRPNSSWGLTTTSCRDQVRLLNRLSTGGGLLSARSRRYARSLLGAVLADQDWGVSGAGHEDETVLVKNGWLPRSTQSGRWLINSVGRIVGDDADIRMAVLSRGHVTMADGVARVERIARIVRSTLEW